jgi:catechol 2,3-dioxygenase
MGQPKAPRFEHAELKVRDLTKSLEFYTDIIGLHEIAREGGVVYLGCGLDHNYDLAIKEGGTGLSHFAIRIDEEEKLDYFEKRLKDHGVKAEPVHGMEPGQEKGIRFSLPCGNTMELVIVADNRYLNPARPVYPRIRGISPLNADHINLMSTNVKKESDFLKEVLEFRFSDIVEPEPGTGNWMMSWLRARDYHHDIALTVAKQPSDTLHHFAWSLRNFDDFKMAADMLAYFGISLELGPGRHPIGPNLYAYFWEPGGNRFELSAEAAIIDPSTPPGYWKSMADTLNAWSDTIPPESFVRGS